ncbi:hypothetical protein [Alcanivorax sp.]|uniref:hypothetical protein n=1 Tax=Alcanivorax sp. TaxID=1872427 RepID=UPI000C0F96EA|nr:hypothetical protein [Alcanivorax sp.]PHR64184.1 MAG: hypothetical protein COA55_14515 [Alcanivorax sp.]
MKDSTFTSVWDAIEDDPAEREDLKARSNAMMRLKAHIAAKGWDAGTAAAELQVDLFLVECLLKGRIGQLDQESLASMQRAAEISTKVVLTPFDPVDYLDSEEAIAEFIEAARETEDEEYIAHANQVADRARRKLLVTR